MASLVILRMAANQSFAAPSRKAEGLMEPAVERSYPGRRRFPDLIRKRPAVESDLEHEARSSSRFELPI
jgi:hypothetical protein